MGLWGPDPGPAPKKPTRNDPPSFFGAGPRLGSLGPWAWAYFDFMGQHIWLRLFANGHLFVFLCVAMYVFAFRKPQVFLFSGWGRHRDGAWHWGEGGATTGPLGGLGPLALGPGGAQAGGGAGATTGAVEGGWGGAAAAMAPHWQGLGEWSPTQLPKMSKKHVLRISPEISPQQN